MKCPKQQICYQTSNVLPQEQNHETLALRASFYTIHLSPLALATCPFTIATKFENSAKNTKHGKE